MTGVLPGRSVRDSQIAELIRGGATAARVVTIGAYRRTWTPDDVARVIQREKLTAPPPAPVVPSLLHPDAPPEPPPAPVIVLPLPKLEPDPTVWKPPTVLAAPQGSVEIGARQAAVLTNLCRGLTNRRIGRELHITEDTVKTHVRHLLAEFGARDRMHLAVLAVTGQVEVRIRQPKDKSR